MEPSFELFDHTADIGIRAWASSMPELVQAAADGLYAVIGELVPGGGSQQVSYNFEGAESAVLLRDYLNELLVLFDCEQRWVTSASVAVFDDARLAVSATSQLVDRERSIYHREVKAITYHELEIRTIAGGFEATMIVDI